MLPVNTALVYEAFLLCVYILIEIYFTHCKVYPFKVYTVQVGFSIVTELHNHHHNPILECFHYPQKVPCACWQAIPIPTHSPKQLPICSLSLEFCLFWKCMHIRSQSYSPWPSVSSFFTQQHHRKVTHVTDVWAPPSFLSYCLDLPQRVLALTRRWTFGLFPVWGNDE